MSDKKESLLLRLVKYVLPIFFIFASFGIILTAFVFKPVPEKKKTVQVLPVVEIIEARSKPITLEARSQGIVESRTETLLVAEVTGRIQSISNSFFAGGYFKKGDPLIEIDPVDYRANLALSKSRLAEARLAYQQEKALADQAREDWESFGRGEGSDLTLRKPQLERAKAVYESTLAGVEMAERDLERTTVKAPYDGRIHEKFADIGQMVSARQSQLARIYSTDTAEIRLPISLKEIEYLELPESYSNRSTNDTKPRVFVRGSYGGEQYEWEGVIDRTEGAIDPKTRLSYVVAKIEEPYKKDENSDRPPLKVGLFVEASIQGKRIDNAFRIPRKALRENNTVYTVDRENRIVFKDVEVYQTDTEWAIITAGLEDGDRICITPLEYAVMGMRVERESKESIEILKTEIN